MALFGTFWPFFGVPFLDPFLVVITLFYRLGGKIDGPKSGQKGAKMAIFGPFLIGCGKKGGSERYQICPI